MSIMPNQSPRMPSAARTIFFWVLMIALAVILWQMDERWSGDRGPHVLVVVLAVIAGMALWTALSKRLRKSGRRGPPSQDPQNRPLG